MTTECQKPKEAPPKCALCSDEHTANYKGCTVYKDLQNARGKHTIKNQQPTGRRTTSPHTTNPPDLQQQMRTSTKYSQVLQSNNMTHQPGDLKYQLSTFLNEFRAMFTQLINQNSMILNMLSTVITHTLNSAH